MKTGRTGFFILAVMLVMLALPTVMAFAQGGNNDNFAELGERIYSKAMLAFNNKDWEKAAKLFQDAGDQRYPRAFYMLGNMYHHGKGFEKNMEKAFEYYQRAASGFDWLALYNVAMFKENGWGTEKNVEEAFRDYMLCADRGQFHEAMRVVGTMYLTGRGVEKDLAKALDWTQRAAKKDNPRAIYNLGIMYKQGLGVEKNIDKAKEYFIQAANHKTPDPKAMIAVAEMFEFGNGVKQDQKQAFQWYMKAAKTGYPDGLVRVADCYYSGMGIEKNQNNAYVVYTQAAGLGSVLGAVRAAEMLEVGEGGQPANPARAAEVYANAAVTGYERAEFNLGLLHMKGLGIEKDEARGMQLIKLAASKNYPPAVKYLEENAQ